MLLNKDNRKISELNEKLAAIEKVKIILASYNNKKQFYNFVGE